MIPHDETRTLFIESGTQMVQALSRHGLRLESNPQDHGAVRAVRRCVHALRRDSELMGFREVTELAQELHDALTWRLRSADRASVAQLVLSAADMFDAMFTAYRGGMEPPSGNPLRAMIAKLAQDPRQVADAERADPAHHLLHVDVANVDTVLNMVGELVAARSMLQQAVREFSRQHPKDPLGGKFSEVLAFQSQALQGLQRAAMGIRGGLKPFSRF